MTTLHKYRTFAREAFLPDRSDKLDCAAFAILLLFAAAAPFLYGVSPAARHHAMGGGTVALTGSVILELLAFLVAGATFLSKSRTCSPSPLAVPLGGMFALALLGFLQLSPLPEKFLELVAPVNLKIYHETAEILRLFGKKAVPAAAISIVPTETFGTVLLILAYTALFFSAATLLRTRLRRRLFSAVLLGTATFQILAGAVRESPEGRVHGVFVNPDHFAAYLEIALAVSFGTLWAEILTNSDRGRETTNRAERFEIRFKSLAWRILLWSVIAVGIGLTQSRGGILSAAITTLVLLIVALSHRRARFHWRAAVSGTIALLAGAVLAATTVGASPFSRFLQLDPRDLRAEDRVAIWSTSLHAWREFPLFGSGLGTFREAFRRVQPRELSGLVEQAHSDSLQLLVTGGAIGAAVGVVAFGSLFFLLIRGWRTQKHREESALALSGFGALLSLTLHGIVDFNLSIPAIAATLACALGAAWAAIIER